MDALRNDFMIFKRLQKEKEPNNNHPQSNQNYKINHIYQLIARRRSFLRSE